MLESLNPGSPERDVTRCAKENGLFTQSLGNFPDVQLVGLEMVQVHVFPHSRQKILKGENIQQIGMGKRRNWSKIPLLIQRQKSHELSKPWEIS